MDALRKFLKTGIGWIVVVGVMLVLLQIGAAVITTLEIEHTSSRIASNLAKLQATTLTDEKTRQEVLNLRIQNEIRGFISNSLLIGTGSIVTAFVALVGGLLGLRNFLEAREKERLDRLDSQNKEYADREKVRQDRASAELKDTIDRLVKNEMWQRAAGILGLQHFLTPDLHDYYLRAVSALAMAARLEKHPEVIDVIRIAVEQAISITPEDLLQKISWQSTKLMNAKFPERPLRSLDFRNAFLNDADFNASDLSGTSFINAQLKGAKLNRCRLIGADLTYADLAGATLVDADLTGATLFHAKVQKMDISGADLRHAKLDADAMPWELIVNWRKAKLDDWLRTRLIERYGDEPSGSKVLMLMWEIPPFVAGGTWTACYHLVRNLRRRGADITVVVPWSESLIVSNAFGSEVRVVALGITPPEFTPRSAQSGVSAFPLYSPYGASWSSYSSSVPSWSPYSSTGSFWSSYGTVSAYNSSGNQHGPSMLLRLIDECRRRFVKFARNEEFDVIHAHDWVTFDAATVASAATGKPWIAHFHSIELDRRPTSPDRIIERFEREAVGRASALITPSNITAQRVAAQYGVAQDKITVVPNTLSREIILTTELGLYETKRTLFLGRLTAQKGPDLFANIAVEVRQRVAGALFEVRGSGDYVPEFWKAGIVPSGSVDWTERGSTFGDVSVVLVPSRAEPFGMVILEAMQHRVPVLYPHNAGAAEVLNTGIKIDPTDIHATADELIKVLTDRNHWEDVVSQQTQEISGYVARGYELKVQELYKSVLALH